MTLLRARIVRWVSDEPIPGWVEAEFVDGDGVRRVLADKSSAFGSDIRPDTPYPVDVLVACEVLAPADDDGRVVITTDRPWGTSTAEGRTEFVVLEDQLVYS
jgi:hypothetical protein